MYQKFQYGVGKVLLAITVALVMVLVVVLCIPLLLWNAPRTYKILERFEAAKPRVRGQWVTAQKLKRLASLSRSDIRMLMSNDHVLTDFVVRQREQAVCERITRISGRSIPRRNRLPSPSTIEFYEFRYLPRGKTRSPSWVKSLQVSLPTVRA